MVTCNNEYEIINLIYIYIYIYIFNFILFYSFKKKSISLNNLSNFIFIIKYNLSNI